MKIEILYPEFCNLFGDMGNMRYLQKCIPEAEFIETAYHDTPLFVKGEADMIYMGPCTESAQIKIIDKLKEYKDDLINAIENDKIFLFTGNAMETLFEYIETDDGSKISGLGIFKLHAVQRLMKRLNTLMLCRFEDIDIVSYKTQFTQTYGDNSNSFFANVERGFGINKESQLEGVHVHNFFGTNMIGPILVTNPYFTEYIMTLLGIENPSAAFRDDAINAYNARIKEYRDKNILFEE